jgi:hypothetical protein
MMPQTPSSPVGARTGGLPPIGPLLWRYLPSLAASFVIPLLLYVLLRPRVGTDTTALAIAGAVPTAWTAARLASRRRVDPVGAISVVGFSVTLFATALLGGNPVLLKVQEAPLTGAIGLAALVSVVMRRPLLSPVLQLLRRSAPPGSRQVAVATAIIGTTLLIDASMRVALALILPTTTFLAVHREISWIVLGSGLALLLLSRRGAREGSVAGVGR